MPSAPTAAALGSHLCRTSVDDARCSIKHAEKDGAKSLPELEAALAYEEAGGRRSSLMQPLRGAIARLKKQAGAEPPNPQSAIRNPQSEAWAGARLYLTAVRDSGRKFIVAQICLGWELDTLKRRLGFAGPGRPANNSANVAELSWDEWLRAEIDLPRRTADRIIEVYHGFREHLTNKLATKLSKQEAGLLETISAPPADLTGRESKAFEKALALATDSLTQGSLLAELRLCKGGTIDKGDGSGGGGEGDDPDDDQKARQLAFAFFAPALAIGRLYSDPQWERRLNTLDLVSDDPEAPSLTRLEADLAAALRDVKAVLKSKRTIDV